MGAYNKINITSKELSRVNEQWNPDNEDTKRVETQNRSDKKTVEIHHGVYI